MKTRKFYLLIVVSFIAISLTSCDASLEITKIELGKFPDNIVYYVDEGIQLDLTGGTVLVYTKGAGISEYLMNENKVKIDITNNIDFSKPGVYEVKIMWGENLAGRFPVQVIEREN